MEPFVLPFQEITNQMIRLVGGKNASLGEMVSHLSGQGIRVPDGFAITTTAYYEFLNANQLEEPIRQILSGLDLVDYTNLAATGSAIRALMEQATVSRSKKSEANAGERAW